MVELRFLRSKVARRIFLLFVTCALLPVVALAVISFRYVVHQLEDQSRQRLHDAVKSQGMDILGRLSVAELELSLAESAISRDGLAIEDLPEVMTERFRGAELRQATAFDEQAREHLGRGQTYLSLETDPGRSLRIFLSKAMGDGPLASVLVGELNLDFLWGRQQGALLPADTELLVLDSSGGVLFSSWASPVALDVAALQPTDGRSSGELRFSGEDGEYIGRFRSLFLKPRYSTPPWTVVLGMRRAVVLAPLSRFTRMLPLVALLTIAVVVLASLSQIGRSLVPLERLRQGTEQIALKRFDTRVQVDSADEFEQLAGSFNAMAARLGQQFKTLATRAGIDRAILATVQVDEIIRIAAARIPERHPCDYIDVTVFLGEERDIARSYLRETAGRRREAVDDVVISPEERCRLEEIGEETRLVSRSRIPTHLGALLETDVEHCLILPVFMQSELAGCLAFGYRESPTLSDDDRTDARQLADQVAVAFSNARLFEEKEQANWETLHALARAVDANSPWTAGHSERVTGLAIRLGQRLDLTEKQMLTLHRGGLLHDIGKIGVPSEILDKPGRLTDEEMEQMRSHPVIGARILDPISAYSDEIPIVLYHHEQYDGNGYPEGLAGERIPYLARVLAVADVYDALSSQRPYRKPWSTDRVSRYIREGAGTLFDPEIVAAFAREMKIDTVQGEEQEGVAPCVVA